MTFNERGDERIAIPAVPGGHGGADPLIVGEFLAYVRDEVEPTISVLAARAAVAAGAMATRSLRNGCQPVAIPPFPSPLRS